MMYSNVFLIVNCKYLFRCKLLISHKSYQLTYSINFISGKNSLNIMPINSHLNIYHVCFGGKVFEFEIEIHNKKQTKKKKLYLFVRHSLALNLE